MTDKFGFMLLAGGTTEKSVDGDGEIIRGTFTTTGGKTGVYRVGDIVYNEKGEQIGLWNHEA